MACGYWKREGGQNREYARCQTGAEVDATVESVARPSTSCAPLRQGMIRCRLYRTESVLAMGGLTETKPEVGEMKVEVGGNQSDRSS
jgi:hypothetical protein